ncbi:hypothetical protein [Corynebacterium halotolerans]|uniref:hypothetical protein n=1 Tax=Corynebacterium halotolerans TaxID=225326 RepID=UPI003CF67C6B
MRLKKQSEKTLRLRSRGNQKVHVIEPRDRAFLEQADALVVKVNKRLDSEVTGGKLRKKDSPSTLATAD